MYQSIEKRAWRNNLLRFSGNKPELFSRHLEEAGFKANQSAQPVFRTVNTNNHGKQKAQPKQYITPEHNEMIRYVQQSWRGVERDYKKSNIVNNIDFEDNKGSTKTKGNGPLLLTGAYHHTSAVKTDPKETFQPFDLEAFWGDRILKRLIQET